MRRAARQQQVSATETLLEDLTKRELEILEMAAEGMRNRAIASQLNISYHTTMKHMSNIISKLHVSNRTEASMLFLRSRNRLLPPGTELKE
jgi:DNA-binding NarL/FixJ family response regulator